jgi:hypothetical protein
MKESKEERVKGRKEGRGRRTTRKNKKESEREGRK